MVEIEVKANLVKIWAASKKTFICTIVSKVNSSIPTLTP